MLLVRSVPLHCPSWQCSAVRLGTLRQPRPGARPHDRFTVARYAGIRGRGSRHLVTSVEDLGVLSTSIAHDGSAGAQRLGLDHLLTRAWSGEGIREVGARRGGWSPPGRGDPAPFDCGWRGASRHERGRESPSESRDGGKLRMGHSQVGSFTVPLCSTAGRPTVRGCQAASSQHWQQYSTTPTARTTAVRGTPRWVSDGIPWSPLVPSGLRSPPSTTHQGTMLSPA
jgi:hypothetical protein